ncbi:nuclease-related domain-containing protein [Niallia sp.]|uniref:nuclease-related domain-containing protein n=1 Tax=Niallia sp. TaxID=2837523 RepID=UPI0037C5840F
MGKNRINNLLSKLEHTTFKRWNDRYVPNHQRNMSQVDHVFLSKNGLYVLETKKLPGWIFGNEKSQFWTQHI